MGIERGSRSRSSGFSAVGVGNDNRLAVCTGICVGGPGVDNDFDTGWAIKPWVLLVRMTLPKLEH